MTQEEGSWHKICEAMVNEADPKKMIELAEKLFSALNEEKMASARKRTAEPPRPQWSSARMLLRIKV
jgi:hypothetical protein